VKPNEKPRNISINSEASIMIYHEGWYYLLVTHGSCCRGADSGTTFASDARRMLQDHSSTTWEPTCLEVEANSSSGQPDD
jgi:hypothetical protein